MALSQDDRAGNLHTPLGKDVLVLSRLDAAETLGGLFVYHIEALSERPNIDFNDLLGLNLSIKLNTVDQLERYFNGVLVQARWTGGRDDLSVYQLVLMPWLWLLSRTSDCRIFSSMPAPDIIMKVFQNRGFTDYRNATTGQYPTLEYCVQYRESDMNFVCRLMEEYGIYYYFEHTEDKHTLVLADSKSSHAPITGLGSAPYLPGTSASARRDKQQFDTWSTFRGFQSGRFVLNDYDYEKPSANLLSNAEHPGGYAHGAMEIYDYPGRYDDQGRGDTLAKVQLEADQAKDERRTADGYAPSLTPGYTISRTSNVGPGSEDIEYLVLRCSHSYSGPAYRSAGRRGEVYNGSYELASSDRPFRSPLTTRKSVIQGPQTAKVVGSGEIDVDKEGRILVQFYWDRNQKQSRRVRVGQIWAGQYQKSLFIPRIGDEVIVQFLEGDPDRPLVVGSVFNADNVPPTTLPDNKTRSGINSESSTGHSGYNHFIFEDLSDQEFVKLRAQKDLIVHVLNDETRNVDKDQAETIGGNLSQTVTGNQTINVGAEGGTYSLTATQEIVLTVGVSSLTITPDSITLSSAQINFEALEALSTTAMTISTEATEISTDAASIEVTSASVAVTSASVEVAGTMTVVEINWEAATGPPPIPV